MDKVSWGVIGAGGIADRRTLPGMMLAENARLEAVMEIDAKHAETLKEKYGAAKAYTSAEELISDPSIDAVYIASPVRAHFEQAASAALAGKHILLEKPLTLHIDEGKELLGICEKQGVLIAAGFMMRFHPYHRTLREMVANGEMGQIVSMRAQLSCWYPDVQDAWRQSMAESGGGALMDMGIHCIDLLQYITRDVARRVTAYAGTKTFTYDVEDSASVLLEFRGGAYGYVDSNFNVPDNASEGRLEIYGTRASALAKGTISQTGAGECRIIFSENADYDASQDRTENAGAAGSGGLLSEPLTNLYTREIESFGNSLLNGLPLEAPASDALLAQQIVLCAYQSARENRTVEIIL